MLGQFSSDLGLSVGFFFRHGALPKKNLFALFLGALQFFRLRSKACWTAANTPPTPSQGQSAEGAKNDAEQYAVESAQPVTRERAEQASAANGPSTRGPVQLNPKPRIPNAAALKGRRSAARPSVPIVSSGNSTREWRYAPNMQPTRAARNSAAVHAADDGRRIDGRGQLSIANSKDRLQHPSPEEGTGGPVVEMSKDASQCAKGKADDPQQGASPYDPAEKHQIIGHSPLRLHSLGPSPGHESSK